MYINLTQCIPVTAKPSKFSKHLTANSKSEFQDYKGVCLIGTLHHSPTGGMIKPRNGEEMVLPKQKHTHGTEKEERLLEALKRDVAKPPRPQMSCLN